MKEIWKDINGFEGKYQISNLGRIRSNNYKNSGKTKLLKISKGTKGYQVICLMKNNKKYTRRIHRLVAEAFIPNPNNYQTVNHIDEDKTNNNVNNLEWCTFEYNTKYGTRAERCGKPIKQLSIDGALIAIYKTSKDAERNTGINHSHILRCCHKQKHYLTSGGYKWEFV